MVCFRCVFCLVLDLVRICNWIVLFGFWCCWIVFGLCLIYVEIGLVVLLCSVGFGLFLVFVVLISVLLLECFGFVLYLC